MVTTEPRATEKQMQFIKSLVVGHEGFHLRAMRSIVASGELTEADKTGDRRHEYREYQAHKLMVDLWRQVTTPATLTQKQASARINRLQQTRGTIVDAWLDNEKLAANYGVLEFINAHRDEIEKASQSV